MDAEQLDRVARIAARTRQRRHSAPLALYGPRGLCWAGLMWAAVLGSIAIGAWWTAQAVQDGQPIQVLIRMAIAVALGVYYRVLWLTVVRPRLLGHVIDLRDDDVIDLR